MESGKFRAGKEVSNESLLSVFNEETDSAMGKIRTYFYFIPVLETMCIFLM